MTLHAIHIFDRKGKTLFTKRYTVTAKPPLDAESASEQRKLIFGMLYSVRELVGSLTPEGSSPALHSIKTGAGTLHSFETMAGLRIALYTNNTPITTAATPGGSTKSIVNNTSFQMALKHIYSEIWVECVVRSPLYRPEDIQVDLVLEGKENSSNIDSSSLRFSISSTNFEAKLDAYLASMNWFR